MFSLKKSFARKIRKSVFVVWLLLLSVFYLFPNDAKALQDGGAEYELKAGFIYNFTQLIKWPEEIASLSDHFVVPFEFSMCVVGKDPFGDLLDVLAKNLRAQGRPMNVLRLKMKHPWYECHILFVPKSENRNMKKILKKVSYSPVLVIGEGPFEGNEKPAISFLIKDETIQFNINAEAIKKSGLTVNSELLDIALEVD